MGLIAVLLLVGVILPSLNALPDKPERHSLYYVYTALSKPINVPGIYEFTGMGVLDNRKIDYYNSDDKMKIPQQKWMRERLPSDYWEKGTQSRKSKEQWFKVNVNILMERKKQNNSDVHVLNWRHGCEVDKYPDGSVKFIRGADQYSYDGQDFLSFDDASMQWVAPVPEAVPTKQKWDGVPILNQYTKGYLEKECVDWLDKFISYADAELIGSSKPRISLFARTSKKFADMLSMTCLATGFLPKDIQMFIQKRGSTVAVVDPLEIYPNGDGTHQARLIVHVPRSEADDYECSVNHRTLDEPVVSKWKIDGIVTDESSSIGVIAGGAAGGAVVLVIAIVVAVVMIKKKGDVTCKTTAQADILLLVDGSWSIGHQNFKTIRAFIARMVGLFDIGPDRVQIGLVQYSGDPKTEWHLNTHKTRTELLDAVAKLPYKGGNTLTEVNSMATECLDAEANLLDKGGNTLTGLALNYILQNNFKASVGMRETSRKIGVLVTGGKSQDDIIVNSQNLRDQNIELYAIGVKNADENELRSIASYPDKIHMYKVKDFSLLDIVKDLSVNLCNSVKGPVASEVTHYSFRATWTAPDGPVEKYRVEYMTVAGTQAHEVASDRNSPIDLAPDKRIVFVDGAVTTLVLENLDPLTEYVVMVYAVVGDKSSEPLKGTVTTRKKPLKDTPPGSQDSGLNTESPLGSTEGSQGSGLNTESPLGSTEGSQGSGLNTESPPGSTEGSQESGLNTGSSSESDKDGKGNKDTIVHM